MTEKLELGGFTSNNGMPPPASMVVLGQLRIPSLLAATAILLLLLAISATE